MEKGEVWVFLEKVSCVEMSSTGSIQSIAGFIVDGRIILIENALIDKLIPISINIICLYNIVNMEYKHNIYSQVIIKSISNNNMRNESNEKLFIGYDFSLGICININKDCILNVVDIWINPI